MSRTTTGRALGPIVTPTASTARCSTWQLTCLCRSTALIGAALEGHTLVVEQLIAAGAALDVQNNFGYGPGAESNWLCAVNRQLTGRLGRLTALIGAASNSHALVVEQLIAAGAKLDVQSGNGCGPCADCNGLTRAPSQPPDVSAGTLRSVARRGVVTAQP